MIKIGKPEIENKGDKSYLKSTIEIPKEATEKWKEMSKKIGSYTYIKEDYHLENDKIDIWYQVPKEYGKYLCDDRIDGFIIAIIYYAMITGQDIVSDAKASKKLLFNLNTDIIPTFCHRNSGFRKISIKAEGTTEVYETEGKNGLGMSCGIDSLYSIHHYTQDFIDDEYKVNCLTFINAGASHFIPGMDPKNSTEKVNKMALELHNNKLERSKEVAKKLNMPIIEIDSNLSDLYQGILLQTHPYRNISAALCLQKYFKKYYYSSNGFEIDLYEPSLYEDACCIGQLLVPSMSTESCEIIYGGQATSRFLKTKELLDDEIAQNYLNVCHASEKNCSRCAKCYRTLLAIEMLGGLDKFSKVFDIDDYKKNNRKAHLWLLANKNDHYAKELNEEAKRLKIISTSEKIEARIRAVLRKFKPIVYHFKDNK